MTQQIRGMFRRFIIIAAALTLTLGVCAVAFAGEGTVSITQEEYELLQQYKHLEEIRQIISQIYYKDVDPDSLLIGAARGLFEPLDDPYSFYYSKDDMISMNEQMSGDYKGIGVQILAHPVDQTLTIVRVFPGSPAEEIGIRSGDKIIQVDDLPVTAFEMNKAVEIMRGGPAGTTVEVTVRRDDEEIMFTVPRGDIHMNNVESSMLDGGIGYIRLYAFEGTMAQEYADALAALREQDMRALVLDLRDNPGGLTDYAERVANTLLSDELIYSTSDRYGLEVSYYADGEPLGMPMVVLCNGNSASASEILIGALKDHKTAAIIGEKTFGKGIIQSVYEFPEGDGMQVTSQQYFTPSGTAIHGVGIEPDIEVKLNEDAIDEDTLLDRDKDNQLQAAVEYLTTMLEPEQAA
ncbi:MAG: S41 family peptidase [Oscillospiraceae bacterium]|jgi:carboxyl-terminal processing protease|nr:S41 family peptidase [Oscillospiraceae bacterium]